MPEESSNIPVAFGFGYYDWSDTYKVVLNINGNYVIPLVYIYIASSVPVLKRRHRQILVCL